MNLRKVLKPEAIKLNLKATNKAEALAEIAELFSVAYDISPEQAVLDVLMEREDKMTTGMQNGIAIPHGKTELVDEMRVVIAVARDGIEFEAMDGKVSTIFVSTLSPKRKPGPHMMFLAEVGRLLSQAVIREKILNADSQMDIVESLVAG